MALEVTATGSNDAVLRGWLNYGCVSGGGATQTRGMRWNTALGHLLVVPPGNGSPGVWTIPTSGAGG
jgi:hypothetical protein